MSCYEGEGTRTGALAAMKVRICRQGGCEGKREESEEDTREHLDGRWQS